MTVYLVPETVQMGRLTAQMVMKTRDEDPIPTAPPSPDTDESDHWSLERQREILGGETYEEYLEH